MHSESVLDAATELCWIAGTTMPEEENPERVKGEAEAYLAFTLNAFKEIVEKYGAPVILAKVDDSTFHKLMVEFYEIDRAFGQRER